MQNAYFCPDRRCTFLMILLFIAFSFWPVSAAVTVTITPANNSFSIYPHEVVEYIVLVKNTANMGVENLSVKVDVDSGLIIPDGFDKLQSKVFTIPVLEAFAEKELKFFIVADLDYSKDLKEKKFLINASYGVSEYTNFAGTYLNVKEEQLIIDAKLSQKSIQAGEDGAVEFSLENRGNEPITDMASVLILPSSVYPKNEKLFLQTLLANEKLSNNKLEFSTDPVIEQKKFLILQVSFADSQGVHALRKYFSFEAKRTINLYWIGIVIVAVLIFIVIFNILKKRKSAAVHAVGDAAHEEMEGEFEEEEAGAELGEEEQGEAEIGQESESPEGSEIDYLEGDEGFEEEGKFSHKDEFEEGEESAEEMEEEEEIEKPKPKARKSSKKSSKKSSHGKGKH